MSNVLIVCGAGISATFLAKRLRSAINVSDGSKLTVKGIGRDALDLAEINPDLVCLSPVAVGAESDVQAVFPNVRMYQLSTAEVAPGNEQQFANAVITVLSTVANSGDKK